MQLEPQAVIAGRYQLERPLGQGGMGMVWAATHVLTGKSVAIKFLRHDEAASAEARRRFVREARAATKVVHPNVVQVHDLLELEDGTPLMVMDRLCGETLWQRLERVRVLSLAETARILLPVISAVGTAHAVGVVHRDLKPDNIFLLHADGGVRVLDFGIAKVAADVDINTAGLTQTGTVLGTPFYMAPEQVFGERDIDWRVDIWALGVIVYECLSGRRPIEGPNVGQIMKGIVSGSIVPLDVVAAAVPADVVKLVGSMLVKERAERLADLREVYRVLSAYTDVIAPAFSTPRYDPITISSEMPAVLDGGASPATASESLPTVAVTRDDAATIVATVVAPRRRSHRAKVRLFGAFLAMGAAAAVVSSLAMRRDRRATAGAERASTAAPPASASEPNPTSPAPGGEAVPREPETIAPSSTASSEPPNARAAPTPARRSAAKPPGGDISGPSSARTTTPTALPGGVYGGTPF